MEQSLSHSSSITLSKSIKFIFGLEDGNMMVRGPGLGIRDGLVGVNESTCDRGHGCEVCSNFDDENSARAECLSSRGVVVRLKAGD